MAVATRLFFLVIQENPEHSHVLEAMASDAADCLNEVLKSGCSRCAAHPGRWVQERNTRQKVPFSNLLRHTRNQKRQKAAN